MAVRSDGILGHDNAFCGLLQAHAAIHAELQAVKRPDAIDAQIDDMQTRAACLIRLWLAPVIASSGLLISPIIASSGLLISPAIARVGFLSTASPATTCKQIIPH